jgi:hypothetical protein
MRISHTSKLRLSGSSSRRFLSAPDAPGRASLGEGTIICQRAGNVISGLSMAMGLTISLERIERHSDNVSCQLQGYFSILSGVPVLGHFHVFLWRTTHHTREPVVSTGSASVASKNHLYGVYLPFIRTEKHWSELSMREGSAAFVILSRLQPSRSSVKKC